MRALVTGGGGFIGSNLVDLLLKHDLDVTVLDDFSSGHKDNLSHLNEVYVIEGDVRDASTVEAAAAGAELIFHMAASVGNQRSLDDPMRDAEINVLGTLQVLQAAAKNSVRKIVLSSSAGIFGEIRQVPIAEGHPTDPVSPYGASKLGAEKAVLAHGSVHGIEVVCLRYFNVYGVRQRYDAYGNVIPIFANHMIHNEPLTVFGDGQQTRDFVNVADVANANLLSGLNVGFSGVLNIASGIAVTINKLIETMSSIAEITPQVNYTTPRSGDVLHSVADVSAAAAAIGYRPQVELAAGLKEYVGWFRASVSS